MIKSDKVLRARHIRRRRYFIGLCCLHGYMQSIFRLYSILDNSFLKDYWGLFLISFLCFCIASIFLILVFVQISSDQYHCDYRQNHKEDGPNHNSCDGSWAQFRAPTVVYGIAIEAFRAQNLGKTYLLHSIHESNLA